MTRSILLLAIAAFAIACGGSDDETASASSNQAATKADDWCIARCKIVFKVDGEPYDQNEQISGKRADLDATCEGAYDRAAEAAGGPEHVVGDYSSVENVRCNGNLAPD